MKKLGALILVLIMGSCNSKADFSGTWYCKQEKEKTLHIQSIAKNTYEISIDDTYTITGEVNENGVLTVNVMGSKSLFTIKDNTLRWSDGDCKEFTKRVQ